MPVPGRTGKPEHPYYPLHQPCHTPSRDKAPTRTRPTCSTTTTPTSHKESKNKNSKALILRAKHIISKGIGEYANPILQGTTLVAPLTTGLAIYAYLPMNQCPLPQPSAADQVFFNNASGESALTSTIGRATLQLTYTEGHYHMDHHTTHGASSHGEPVALARAITRLAATLPAYLTCVVRVWFVVDATVDTHLPEPLHKATATSISTQALMLWKVLRSLPPYVQLCIVKQESCRHQYGTSKVDI